MKRTPPGKPAPPAQLGLFGAGELAEADARSHAGRQRRRLAHLPTGWDEGLAAFRALLGRYDAAVRRRDPEAAFAEVRLSRDMAVAMMGGDRGILAGPESVGCRLRAATAAPPGTEPTWGQAAAFVVVLADGMRVGVETDGVMGMCADRGFSASANVVDLDAPFLSETGYRSFLGLTQWPDADEEPASYWRRCFEAHVAGELKGKPVRIPETALIRRQMAD